jgi:hypothetical protein
LIALNLSIYIRLWRQLPRFITLKTLFLGAKVRSRIENDLCIWCCHNVELAYIRAIAYFGWRLEQGMLRFENRLNSINKVILRTFAIIFRENFLEIPMLNFKGCFLQHIYVVFVFSKLLMLKKEVRFVPSFLTEPSAQNLFTFCLNPWRINH